MTDAPGKEGVGKWESRGAHHSSGWPHPRDRHILFGHGKAEKAFLSAYRSNRMPHAWLIRGQEGIGKATLAYRIARFILGHPDPSVRFLAEVSDLCMPQGARVACLIAAQSHPDLHVLCRLRAGAGQETASIITVDSVHAARRFLSLTTAEGGWRVLIIDSVDEMSISAMNALLKTLEEPAERSLLLLISHLSGGLPATIRSRCRTLNLEPLGVQDLLKTLDSVGYKERFLALQEAERHLLIDLSRGSARRAMLFLDGSGLILWNEIDVLCRQLPALDGVSLHRLVNYLEHADAQEKFSFIMELLCDWLSLHLRHRVEEGIVQRGRGGGCVMAALPEAWSLINRLLREARLLNLDRKRVLLGVFHSLAMICRKNDAEII